jgi:hypothetical protein
MIRVSLTDFVDIVSKSGTPKATKVAQVKKRGRYEPAVDFYNPSAKLLLKFMQAKRLKKEIDAVIRGLTDRKKRENYPLIIEGYKKWWGSKNFDWHEPQRTQYSANGVEIIVNPELCLEFNGMRHLIKLYFKSEVLSKAKVVIITDLMELSLRNNCCDNEIMGVLDARNAKLIDYDGKPPAKHIIDAELAYIASIWASV